MSHVRRVAAAALLLASFSAWTELAQVWSFMPAGEQFDGSVGLADLNGDGALEIITPTIQGAVIALDAQGRELWRWRQPDPISAPPAIAEVVASSPGPEILVLTNTGKVYCLASGTGEILWLDALSGSMHWGSAGIAVADLDGDGTLEMVMADARGEVSAKRGDGSEFWNHREEGGLKSAPAVGDLDGDGKPEVLIAGSAMTLLCLDNTGRPLWRMAGTPGAGAPVLADLDGDGTLEILLGVGDALCVIGHDGETRWSVPLSGPMDSGVSVADLDGDGSPEIVVVDLKGGLAVMTAGGQPLWTAEVEGRARRSPSVADLEGDGSPEILVAGYSGAVHVFSAKGELLDRADLGGASNATAAVARLRDDEPLTVICPVVTGSLTAFQWVGGGNGGAVLWPEYRFDSLRTGVAKLPKQEPRVRITRFDTGRAYVGRNEFSVEVENPKGEKLAVTLEVRQGERGAQKQIEGDAPVLRAAAPYVMGGREAAELVFECVVRRGDEELARQSRALKAAPFAAELAEVGLAALRMETLAGTLPADTAPGVEREALYWQAKLPGLRERASAAALLSSGELNALTAELSRARADAGRMAAVAALRAASDSPLHLRAANPWATFGGMDELLEGRVASPEMRVEAFSGEIESGALNLFNLGGAPMTLRVEAGPLTHADGSTAPASALIVREAVAVPTQMSDTAADAIPLLNQAGTVMVPALDARQLYFEVDTKGLAPGEWSAELRLCGLDTAATEAKTTLRLTVWRAALPEKQTLGLCHWGYVHSSMLKDMPEAALADQVRHGTNVFVGLFPPRGEFDADGNLTGPLDFSKHDDYLDQHAQHGLILFYTYDSALKGPAEKFSDTWNRAHVAYLRAWVEHLKARGMEYGDWALYTIDEPGLRDGLVDIHNKLGKLAREANPAIRIYTDPVGDASLEDLQSMAPYTDIWCPHRNTIVNKPDTTKLDFIKSTGGTVFTYECQDNVKHRSPLGYYRGQAWLAWMHGFKAVGFWAYCTSQYDPWFNNGEAEYLLIYPGDGVVPSKRWHAVRDGIEDHAMLSALRDAADAAEAAGRAPEAVAEARRLLGADATVIARFCGLDDDGETPGPGGLAGQRRVEDRRWKAVQEARAETARLLAELTRETH